MRALSKLLLLSLLPILVLGIVSLSKCSPRDEGDKKVDAKTVPLGLIYSTSRQKGLKVIDQGRGDKGFPNVMRELYRQSIWMGASNVFLARGDDIAAAVGATWEVFTHGQSASEPVSTDRRSKSEQYWLVAYLGVGGSDPPAWRIKSAEVSGRDIRLAFTKPGSSSTDLHPYFVWVPLGRLKAGTYVLEMFDEEQRQVMLSRRVTLPRK